MKVNTSETGMLSGKMANSMKKLSIIIPVYCNADTLLDCYDDLKANALPLLPDYEIILVDDGSEDNSWEICCDIAAKEPKARIVRLSRNFGSHAACLAGLNICVGDCATTKSADCQEPSSLIVEMFGSWERGNRVILAVRTDREEGFMQKAFAGAYYGLVRWTISKKMPKTGFDCYLIDRKVIEALKLLDERNSAITLQILWAGFKTDIVPYTRLARQKGRSRWTLRKKVKLVLDSLITFSYAPVRLVEYLGVLFAAGAFTWGIVILVHSLINHSYPTGWTAMMLVILFSSGLIMFSLGLLGEYIWRTLDVAQNRPVYFVEESINENDESNETLDKRW